VKIYSFLNEAEENEPLDWRVHTNYVANNFSRIKDSGPTGWTLKKNSTKFFFEDPNEKLHVFLWAGTLSYFDNVEINIIKYFEN